MKTNCCPHCGKSIEHTNLKERKAKFALKLAEYKNDYKRDMLEEFYHYWVEHGENDRKMRFEKQTSFYIKRRLATWAKRRKVNNESFQERDNSRYEESLRQTKLLKQAGQLREYNGHGKAGNFQASNDKYLGITEQKPLWEDI